jgi:hypothetical protein
VASGDPGLNIPVTASIAFERIPLPSALVVSDFELLPRTEPALLEDRADVDRAVVLVADPRLVDPFDLLDDDLERDALPAVEEDAPDFLLLPAREELDVAEALTDLGDDFLEPELADLDPADLDELLDVPFDRGDFDEDTELELRDPDFDLDEVGFELRDPDFETDELDFELRDPDFGAEAFDEVPDFEPEDFLVVGILFLPFDRTIYRREPWCNQHTIRAASHLVIPRTFLVSKQCATAHRTSHFSDGVLS